MLTEEEKEQRRIARNIKAKEYRAKHKDEINARRREKYHSDEELRKAHIKRCQAYLKKRMQEDEGYREKINQYWREWRKEHREEFNASRRGQYNKYAERRRETSKRYYYQHKEEQQKRFKKYYQKNREKILKRQKEYYKRKKAELST